MNDQSMKVFIDAVSHYFDKLGDDPVTVGAPFLIQDINRYLGDYTGIIGISGNHRGSVFVSAPKLMLSRMLTQLGITAVTESRLMDLAGEVCNTISGNARREFGDQFMLSVPIVFKGQGEAVQVSTIAHIYVIPIVWHNMKANIIINLGQGED